MITIELKQDQVGPALRELAALLDDLTPVMQGIGEYLVDSTRQRFVRGESPEGARWAPKSPVTLARYGARRSNRVDIRPLFGPSGSLSTQILTEATSDSVSVGSNLIYAAVMQFGAAQGAFGRTSRGGPIPWGSIPARPFLGLSPEDETAIVAITAEWIARIDGS